MAALPETPLSLPLYDTLHDVRRGFRVREAGKRTYAKEIRDIVSGALSSNDPCLGTTLINDHPHCHPPAPHSIRLSLLEKDIMHYYAPPPIVIESHSTLYDILRIFNIPSRNYVFFTFDGPCSHMLKSILVQEPHYMRQLVTPQNILDSAGIRQVLEHMHCVPTYFTSQHNTFTHNQYTIRYLSDSSLFDEFNLYTTSYEVLDHVHHQSYQVKVEPQHYRGPTLNSLIKSTFIAKGIMNTKFQPLSTSIPFELAKHHYPLDGLPDREEKEQEEEQEEQEEEQEEEQKEEQEEQEEEEQENEEALLHGFCPFAQHMNKPMNKEFVDHLDPLLFLDIKRLGDYDQVEAAIQAKATIGPYVVLVTRDRLCALHAVRRGIHVIYQTPQVIKLYPSVQTIESPITNNTISKYNRDYRKKVTISNEMKDKIEVLSQYIEDVKHQTKRPKTTKRGELLHYSYMQFLDVLSENLNYCKYEDRPIGLCYLASITANDNPVIHFKQLLEKIGFPDIKSWLASSDIDYTSNRPSRSDHAVQRSIRGTYTQYYEQFMQSLKWLRVSDTMMDTFKKLHPDVPVSDPSSFGHSNSIMTPFNRRPSAKMNKTLTPPRTSSLFSSSSSSSSFLSSSLFSPSPSSSSIQSHPDLKRKLEGGMIEESPGSCRLLVMNILGSLPAIQPLRHYREQIRRTQSASPPSPLRPQEWIPYLHQYIAKHLQEMNAFLYDMNLIKKSVTAKVALQRLLHEAMKEDMMFEMQIFPFLLSTEKGRRKTRSKPRQARRQTQRTRK